MKDLWNPIGVSLCVAALVLTGCGSDNGSGPEEPNPYNTARVDLFDTPSPGAGYIFQLWAAGGTAALVSSGTASWAPLVQFDVVPGDEGVADTLVTPQGTRITQNTFTNLSVDLDEYDSLYITIEEDEGMAATPSATICLQAAIPDDLDSVSIARFNFPVDLSGRQALSQLMTPTDEDSENEFSGVWFMQFFPYQTGLTLPDAPPGWRYEGWAYHDATWLSTGRFVSPVGNDEFNGYSNQDLPGFPGEDFLNNPPQGAIFPWVFTAGDKIAISIEPHPDTDPGPFPIQLFDLVLEDPVNSNIAHSMSKTGHPIPSGNVHLQRGD